MSPHWNTLSLFRANQSLLSLLSAACLAEKQQINKNTNCIVLGSTRSESNPRSTVFEASMLTITSSMRFIPLTNKLKLGSYVHFFIVIKQDQNIYIAKQWTIIRKRLGFSNVIIHAQFHLWILPDVRLI